MPKGYQKQVKPFLNKRSVLGPRADIDDTK